MKIELKLKPFTVPNFVTADMPPGRRQDGLKELPSFPLSVVPAETLEQLCETFRREVFEKAGKADPDWERPKQAKEPQS